MIIKYEKTAAYICPFCSNLTRKRLSAFDFSGTKKKELLCSTPGCHETCARFNVTGGKYKISVECPVCGDSHTYMADSVKFWKKRLATYKCPVSGIEILFCGDDNAVDRVIEEISGEYGEIIPDFDDNSPESELLYEIVDCVHELRSEGKISCVCGSESVSVQIINNCVVLVCDKCGRGRIIETNEHNLAMLMNAEAVVIGN